MPLSITIGVVALIAVIAWQLSSRERASTGRVAVSVGGLWIALIFLAILMWALATLIFGR